MRKVDPDSAWLVVNLSILFLTAAGVVFLVVMAMLQDMPWEKWDKYRAQHSCELVLKTPGRSGTTNIMTPSGYQMASYTISGSATYQCDNGTITREEN